MTLEKPPSRVDEAEPATVSEASDIGQIEAAPKALRPVWLRMAKWLGGGLLALVAVSVGGLAALLYFNIESSPAVGRFVRDMIVDSLQDRLDPALRVSIDDVDIRRAEDETFVDIAGFRVRDIANRSVIHAGSGRIILASAPLFALKAVPVAITLRDVHADIEVAENGTIAFDSISGATEMPPQAPSSLATTAQGMQQIVGGAFIAIAALRESVGGKLPDVGIESATLALSVRGINRRFDLSRVSGRLQTYPDGASTARIEFRSGSEPVAVDMHLTPAGNETQRLKASADAIKLTELFRQFGVNADAIDKGATVSLSLDAEVDQLARAKSAALAVQFGPATVKIDRKVRPIPFESSEIRMSWVENQDSITIDEVAARTDGSLVRLTGRLAPSANQPGWNISLNDNGSTLAPLAKGDKPIVFDRLVAGLTVLPEARVLTIDDVQVTSGNATAQVSGKVFLEADSRPGINMDVAVRNVDARVALRLWPASAAPELRAWLVGAVRGGAVSRFDLKSAFSADALEAAVNDLPVPAEALAWSFAATRGVFAPLPDASPIAGLVVEGSGDGRRAEVTASTGFIDVGQGRRLNLSDATFSMADVSKKPADARLTVKVAGTIDAALAHLRSEGMRAHAPKGIGDLDAKGEIEGELVGHLRISPTMTPNDTRIGLTARLKNVTTDKALGEKIEGGNFQLTVDKDTFAMKGDARLMGSMAAIEVRGTAKAPPVATATLNFDDAARARNGMNFGPDVTGPVPVKLIAKLDGDNSEVAIDADLARVAIAGAIPGFAKRAGTPGRLRAVAQEGDKGGWTLEKLEFDAGNISVRGSVTVGGNGEFLKATLSQVKLSQGDALQMDIDKSVSGMRISARGNSLDARPFLKSLLTGGIDKAGGKDFELNLRSTVLSGFNGELLANADVKLQSRAGGLHRFELTGRFGSGPVAARLQPGKTAALTIVSEDGGAFFRFFDIYNRMRGGRLELSAQLNSGGQAGQIVVKNFALRDEPALKRLVADNASTPAGDSSRLQLELARRLRNVHDVPFARMQLGFTRTPGRLDIRDGLLIGQEVGGNISGRMDFARDTVDMTGTFVPAFSLNNALANVPVLGPIILGGRNEGLFAVRYAITGKVSSPNLSIDPLTAIAPGFLRKLIDFRGMGGNDPVPRPEQ